VSRMHRGFRESSAWALMHLGLRLGGTNAECRLRWSPRGRPALPGPKPGVLRERASKAGVSLGRSVFVVIRARRERLGDEEAEARQSEMYSAASPQGPNDSRKRFWGEGGWDTVQLVPSAHPVYGATARSDGGPLPTNERKALGLAPKCQRLRHRPPKRAKGCQHGVHSMHRTPGSA